MKSVVYLTSILLLIIAAQTSFANPALEFDQNELLEVNVPHSESLDITGTDFTFECWINSPNPADGVQKIVASKQGVGNDGSWKIRVNNNGQYQMRFIINGAGAGWFGTGDVQANRWTHVATTYDGQVVRTLVDGEVITTTNQNGNITSCDEPFRLARRDADDANFFSGLIDEVRLWSVVRTPDEIAEQMNVMLSGDEEGLEGYWRLDEGEGQVLNDLTANENHGWLGADPDEDARDPAWVDSDAPIFGGVIDLSDDSIEFGPTAHGGVAEYEFWIANISEDDDDFHNIDFTISDLGDEPNWLDIEPTEGSIEPGDTLIVTMSVNTDDMEFGEYRRTIAVESNAMNLSYQETPVHIFVVEGFGQLSGRVTDAETEQPIENALVSIDGFGRADLTDEQGRYSFDELPAWIYNIMVTHEQYLPTVEADVDLNNGDELSLNFELLYSEFVPNPDRIELTVAPDDSVEFTLLIGNDGNGPLTWSVQIALPHGDIEPWELLDNLPAGEQVDDSRMTGVQFADDHYYVSGGNFNGDDENRIYVFNRGGDLVRSFPQFTDSRYGIRDMTWDGELLWGGDADTIYGFTTDGDLIAHIASPVNPARCLTWDSDHQLFWVSDISSDIIAFNLNGEVVQEIDRPVGLRKYGLSWFPNDPDDFNLYFLSSTGEDPLQFYKVNIETEEIALAADLSDIEGASEGGFTITTRYDPLNWMVINFLDNLDAVNVMMLHTRSEWISAVPLQGVTDPDDMSEINLRFATSDFSIDTELEAQLLFTHDGRGATEVPVNVTVSDEGGIAQRLLHLDIGWNLISANITPEAENLSDVLVPLTEDDKLMLAKNGSGQFYLPGEFDNIGAWQFAEGYWLKMAASSPLRINGEMLPADTPIQLEDGWNSAAYMPRVAVSAPVALSGIAESLTIAKDGHGRFYIPQYGFSDLTMREGNGCQLLVGGDIELQYRDMEVDAVPQRYTHSEINWLNELTSSPKSYSLLLLTDLSAGTRLEAYDRSAILAGRGVVGSDGKCGMTLWECEDTGGITISRLNGDKLSHSWINWSEKWGVVTIKSSLPESFTLRTAYPNPFNSVVRFRYGIPDSRHIIATLYDINGRIAAELQNETVEAGHHELLWDAADMPTGTYLLQIVAGEQRSVKKVVLLR